MSGVDVLATFTPTAEQVAAMFWELDAEQQADFFAALERKAGFRLCVQMAAVVDAIRKRSEAGNLDAMNGFQTMLAHAQGYHESATEFRVWEAQRELARMAEAALARVGGAA